MIKRLLQSKLQDLSKKMPVVAIVGPRQSGKTTLARETFKKHKYISLENLKNREFAQEDPQLFLETNENKHGIILDEIQNVPDLLSYIQVHSDEYKRPGYFVLTGSQNILVNQAITQTLAGRVAFFTLLPLSLTELQQTKIVPSSVEEYIFKGSYPRVYADNLNPLFWYPDYLRTYVERDVRSIRNIENLSVFQRFIGLCAGRIGQLLNFTSLANDCGITVATAKSWLSLLQASYIIFLLQPYYKNIGKRLVKSPKLYFYDSGLACSILGIESANDIATHYLRGGLFESLIISDLLKQRYNNNRIPHLYFWRDKVGNELDAMFAAGEKFLPIEIKAGKSISKNYFSGLEYWSTKNDFPQSECVLIYAGDENQKRKNGRVTSWKSAGKILDSPFT